MRFLIVDTYAILTAHYEQEKSRKVDNAAVSTFNSIRSLKEEWDVCIAVFDAAIEGAHGPLRAPSFRASPNFDPPRADPEDPSKRIGYKAGRPDREAQFFARREELIDRCGAEGYHVFVAPERWHSAKCDACNNEDEKVDACERCKGDGFVRTKPSGFYYEADDVCATAVDFLCWHASQPGVASHGYCSECSEPGLVGQCECGGIVIADAAPAEPPVDAIRVVSSDKDLAALVDPSRNVEVLSLATSKLYTLEAVRERFGVDPARVPHFLALAGDRTDGFAPFRGPIGNDGKRKAGIGEETAKRLLAAFGGDAEAAVRAAIQEPPDPKIDKNTVALLRRAGGTNDPLHTVKVALAIATMCTDVPLDFEPVLKGPLPMRPLSTNTKGARHVGAPPGNAAPAPSPVGPKGEPEVIEGEPVASPARSRSMALATIGAPMDLTAFQPRSIDELANFANIVLDSHGYAQFQNVEQIMCVAAEAREKGIPMMAALRGAYFTKGRIAWSAQLIAFLAERAARVFKIVETTHERAVVEYQRQSDAKSSMFEFTIDEARNNGWMKSGEKGDNKWITQPRTMLRWAALRECARFAFPGAVLGMYTPKELNDGPANDDGED